ncbi:DNA replication/repair protein RecF [Enterovirga sp.]|uniref:DNA replication/repair protein RecF n=1 Tax=Enterovirga sp. TaxID=2026350 RepID=UPI0026092903|nr:DNA replication/repair protein RecF [Enterovirga sp.]MDB5589858.1 replication/repair protein RecF [Enterovirga sp.]
MTDAPRVTRLILEDFRSYAALDLSLSRRLVALSGENGSGKTNLLEALSLFAPGRGLRRAELGAMARQGRDRFAVSLTLSAGEGEHRLGCGLGPPLEAGARPARTYRVDGLSVTSALGFAEHVRLVWLTPDQDGLFRGTPGERRRFLDRLVLAMDSRHAARVTALERALRSRNRLLEDGAAGRWLDAAERELAELAVAVAAARRETAGRLDAELLAASGEDTPFPFARLVVSGEFEDLAAGLPALDLEDRYRAQLRDSRARDLAAGRTLIGPQSADLLVRHGPKDLPAESCSTGEQKALLLRLVLAHARLVERVGGLAPLVLLDEVAAHLDPRRRAALYGTLETIGGQVWMTGADPGLFAELEGRADLVRVTPGQAGR